MSNLKIALSYLKKGYSVIPLYSPEMLKHPNDRIKSDFRKEVEKNNNCEDRLSDEELKKKFIFRKCKESFIPWKEYQTRLPTKEEVTKWFTENPSANIAIITGPVSNLVVFDFDKISAFEEVQEIGGLPESTIVARTGRGFHVYIKYPDFNVSISPNADFGLDIKSTGGYVVAPPSIHGSGSQYEWVEGSSIKDVAPAPCTPWMIEYLKNKCTDRSTEKKKKENNAPDHADKPNPVKQEHQENDYLNLLKDGCIEGERNNSATKLIGHFFATGIKAAEVWEMIQIWNRDKVKPPLGSDELKKIYDSIKSSHQKNKVEVNIQIESLLDNSNKVVNEFTGNFMRIPFAGDKLRKMEKMMNGGLIGGCSYILGGIPSSGKTTIVNNIADNICLNHSPVLFFTYDDVREELRHRTLSRFSTKSIDNFNSRSIKDIANICNQFDIQHIMPMKYVVQQMVAVEKWDHIIEQIKSKHGQPPVIIIDYLRKLRTEKNQGDERLRVDDILSKLTDIAKKYNTPVISISELARDSYKSGQRLSMASFKESGSIEYEASWLGILAAVEEVNGEYIMKNNWQNIIKHDGNIDLIVFKAKRGTGATGKIPLKLSNQLMTVCDRP